MGTMTLAYGAAQIIAPVSTGYLVEALGNYDIGLYLSATVVMMGTLFLFGLLNLDKDAIKNTTINIETKRIIG